MTTPLLAVEDLQIRIPGSGPGIGHDAVRGVGFTMGRERLGIVGESGAGKSLLARALLRLLPAGAEMTASRLQFDGIDLLGLDEGSLRKLRGKRLSLILQDPRFSLNPAMPAGEQIAEALRAHRAMSRRAARDEALRLIAAVQIREAETVYRRYPHQLSGGMGQRIMIAMMLAPDPDLLIADEPTSALDASVAGGILALLDAEVTRRRMGIILISHDLDLVAAFCDRVLVMKDGAIVEALAARDLADARHPYTRQLMAARLGLDA
jgi:peptide/nickel transport system ATP-binding protein